MMNSKRNVGKGRCIYYCCGWRHSSKTMRAREKRAWKREIA